MEGAFVRSAQDVLGHFKVSEQTGLSAKAVKANRETYGENGKANSVATDVLDHSAD